MATPSLGFTNSPTQLPSARPNLVREIRLAKSRFSMSHGGLVPQYPNLEASTPCPRRARTAVRGQALGYDKIIIVLVTSVRDIQLQFHIRNGEPEFA